jgi:hypothetical protein
MGRYFRDLPSSPPFWGESTVRGKLARWKYVDKSRQLNDIESVK